MSKSLLLVAMLSVLAVATPASAELKPFQNDADAYYLVGNCSTVDQCFASGSWSTAGGMTACTTNDGCLRCGNDANTGTAQCSRLRGSNGSCECSTHISCKWVAPGVSTCQTLCSGSGTCTYKL